MSRKISTLNDLKKKNEEEEKQQQFFAGGTDNRGGGSGQNVLGPPPSNSNYFQELSRSSSVSKSDAPSKENKTVTLFKNGFTIDDSPLRDYTSPQNVNFLQSLLKGQIPPELAVGGDIGINVIDKQSEEYVAPPPPAYVPFSNGNKLGVAESSSGATVTPSLVSTLPPSAEAVNEAQPVTTLQVRTLTGQRLKIRLNHSATVLQLVIAVNSQFNTMQSYVLSAGYPPRDLTDFGQTLEAAGLLNAAVTMRPV